MDETWDGIADWYTSLVRNGSPMHEFARDILLAALPHTLSGLDVLDVGCGEGLITRALAGRGACAVGIDPTRALIEHARTAELNRQVGAEYRIDDAATLTTVGSKTVDWVTAGLSLNNVPDLQAALTQIERVLRPSGGLAFTVPHPCFESPFSSATFVDGTVRRVVGDYLSEGLWKTTSLHSVRRAGNYHRTISTYINAVTGSGFRVNALTEPAPNRAVTETDPHRVGLPPFLLVSATLT